jgi:hypothetical protein
MTGISAAVIPLESTEEVRGNSCESGRNCRPFVPKEGELSWFRILKKLQFCRGTKQAYIAHQNT